MQGLVYITAVLEYLCAELCDLTAKCAKEYPSKLKLDSSNGEARVIDSDDEDDLVEDWAVQDLHLAEPHHVLKAIHNDKEMSKAFKDHGSYLAYRHWSAFLPSEDNAEHDDDEEEDEDEPVSSKKAGKAKAGTSRGIVKPKKCTKGKAA